MTAKKQILFVDDDSHLLEGLERMLFGLRRTWDMSFVGSGAAALELLRSRHCDVIVADMRMPGMDGAELLAQVQKHHSNVIRIILSGHADAEAAIRAVPVAHQFLAKPCEPQRLKATVERCCELHDILKSEALRKAVGAVDTLPSVPATYRALSVALADPGIGLGEVAAIVESDVAMCAKILQLVNSAFFGLPRHVSDVRSAATLLGGKTLSDLVLCFDVFGASNGCIKHPLFDLEALQQDALLTAQIARHVAVSRHDAEGAFMAGMLHDVGRLVLAKSFGDDYSRALDRMSKDGTPELIAESDELGVSHAEIGAYLLGMWGLPYPIIEAVLHHHHPQHVNHDEFDVLAAVYVGHVIAGELVGGVVPGGTPPLDMDYLDRFGLAGEVSGWREWARERAGTSRSSP